MDTSSARPSAAGAGPTRISGEALADLESLLLANVRDAIVVVDAAGVITYWNDGATHIFGWTADEMLGTAFERTFPAVAAAGVTALIRSMPPDATWFGEHLDKRKDGRPVLLKARLRQVADAAGAFNGILGWAEDITDQRATENALRASEERYRNLIDLAPEAIAIVQAGRCVYANRVAAALMGAPAPADLVGKALNDYIHPDDVRASRSRQTSALDGTMAEVLSEVRLRRLDGTYSLLETHAGRCEFNGAPALQIVARDITERRKGELALRESEARLRASEHRYRTFVDHASDALFLHDHVGCVLDANVQACESLGYSREELIGQKPIMFDPVITDDTLSGLLKSLDEGHTGTFESVHRRKDGSTFPVEIRIRPFTLDGGRVALSLARDISDRRAAEQALRRSDDMLRRAQRIALIGSWSIDAVTNHFHASDETRRLCHLEGDGPWQTADIFQLLHPDDRERGLDVWRRAIGGESCEFEHRLVVNGHVRWCYSASTTERDTSGRPTLVTGITQDISARRRLEEQFQQAQKMEAVGKLAGGVAHDFNNMLTVINGYTDLLLSELELYDPRREKITQVREAGERAAGLTRQLLAFSRKQILAPRLVNLNDIVRRAEVMLRRLIGEDVTVVADLDPSLALLKADPSQLEQVLLNLAVNARDAMPHGGHLTVATRTVTVDRPLAHETGDLLVGDYVELRVSDTGCGMPPDVRDRVFEPFFTTKPTGTGTGLGLSTVYGIVKQSGGHISVDSTLGEGSSFRILLPAAPSDATVAMPALPTDASLHGTETVLVVEDEESVRRVARIALEMHGYRVIEAAGGDEARRWAVNYGGPIHLVLTDVVMAEMSGRDVADLLRAMRPGIRVLFMSGYTDDAVVRHGVLDASDHFLQKPFTPASLAATVRRVLDET